MHLQQRILVTGGAGFLGSHQIFRLIAPELVFVKPIEAEFAKLFNNAYRYIEFAATNQFYMIAKSAGAGYQAIMAGDEAELSAREKLSRSGIFGRPLLV
jgi:UDP-N-acetyl-D-mannosaminuronic acid dehydrogenase